MGKAPDVIIIARHGARLDAADKQWHLSSPTPYDPPLTYGGWAQGRALGARIANLLQAREEAPGRDTSHASYSDDSGSSSIPTPTPSSGGEVLKRSKPIRIRKHKVIIHTSPFLRCVQTAVAISAGYRQFQKIPLNTDNARTSTPSIFMTAESEEEHLPPVSANTHGPPAVHKLDQTEADLPESTHTALTEAKLETAEKPASPGNLYTSTAKITMPKCQLRVDAFLGEWLSPDYFEKIAPPPSSAMMVVHAKAELLKRAEVIQDSGAKSMVGHFPGGWNNNSPTLSASTEDKKPVFGTGIQRERSQSQGIAPGAPVPFPKFPTNQPTDEGINLREGYMPPVPSYAISPSDPIPAGYVAHARDACVAPDYQWDSMREPQNWGGGGEFGEEWSSMHVRFRKGFHHMIDWYRKHDQTFSHGSHGHHGPYLYETHEEDEYTDLVLVLVTHGAGCNALIGSLTGQPALLDVSMASMTMAVQKSKVEKPPDSVESVSSQRKSRRKGGHLSIASEYEIKLLASTEHLYAGSHSLSIPSLPTPPTKRSASTATTSYRHRLDSASRSHEVSNYLQLGDHSRRYSNDMEIRRQPRGPARAMFRRGTGLWGSSFSSNDRFDDSGSGSGSGSEDDFIPNFKSLAVTSSPAQPKKAAEKKDQPRDNNDDIGGNNQNTKNEATTGTGAATSIPLSSNNENNNDNNGNGNNSLSNESIATKGWAIHQHPERPRAQTGLWSPAQALASSAARQAVQPARRWTVTDH